MACAPSCVPAFFICCAAEGDATGNMRIDPVPANVVLPVEAKRLFQPVPERVAAPERKLQDAGAPAASAQELSYEAAPPAATAQETSASAATATQADIGRRSGQDEFNDWELTFSKQPHDGTMLGLSLTFFYARTAVVQDVLDTGLIKDYNATHLDETAVRPGDVLRAVNDVKDDTVLMFSTYTKSASVKLGFRRVREFNATIKGPLVPSAKDFSSEPTQWPDALVLSASSGREQIVQVNGSLLKEYNKTCECGLQILPGDRVVAINGLYADPTEGAPSLLAKVLVPAASGNDQEVRLRVVRPA